MKEQAVAIGFRADPSAVYWAVVSDPPLRVEASGKLPAPKSYDEAAALGWYRTEVRNLIDQYKPKCAGVRYQEPVARIRSIKSTCQRVRIEGVVLEASNSKGISVLTGAMATITAELESESAKAYIETDSFRGLDWSALSDNLREAVLVAGAALGHRHA